MTIQHPLGEVLHDGKTVGLRFERQLSHPVERGVDKTAAGYHVCLDQLVSLVETDNPPAFTDADPTAYEHAYAYLAD